VGRFRRVCCFWVGVGRNREDRGRSTRSERKDLRGGEIGVEVRRDNVVGGKSADGEGSVGVGSLGVCLRGPRDTAGDGGIGD
jgi:hypothetical protein